MKICSLCDQEDRIWDDVNRTRFTPNATDPSGLDTVMVKGRNVVWVAEQRPERHWWQAFADGMLGRNQTSGREYALGQIETDGREGLANFADGARRATDLNSVNDKDGYLHSFQLSDNFGGCRISYREL